MDHLYHLQGQEIHCYLSCFTFWTACRPHAPPAGTIFKLGPPGSAFPVYLIHARGLYWVLFQTVYVDIGRYRYRYRQKPSETAPCSHVLISTHCSVLSIWNSAKKKFAKFASYQPNGDVELK